MKKFIGFERGIGIGGWLTNFKRYQCIRPEWRDVFTTGDLEHFQTYITESDVANIARLGFDHIRVCFDQIVLQNADGSYNETYFTLLDNFIAWCEKYNLNVVLNLHKAVGNYCDVFDPVSLLDSAELRARFVSFWLAFEKRYANKPQVAFEILNEVKNVEPSLWNTLAEETLTAIRSLNKNRVVILGCIDYGNVDKLDTLQIFDDENVVYTFHFYKPEEFTHQRGVLFEPYEFYNRNMPYPCDIERYEDYRKTVYGVNGVYKGYKNMDGEWINNMLAPVKKWMEKHPDKILWCGEFGTIRHAKLAWRIAWFKDVIGFLKENEIPYSVWNYLSTPNDGNRFSLVDDDERNILSEELRNVLLGEF